jgi:hypothetical protein
MPETPAQHYARSVSQAQRAIARAAQWLSTARELHEASADRDAGRRATRAARLTDAVDATAAAERATRDLSLTTVS